MCGIAGYRVMHGLAENWAAELPAAVKSLAHRGPDDQGIWIDAEGTVGLGHRRLSILDLSEHGHQPMASACGQWMMVFNGEVYNFKSIRAELEPLGHRFSGTGDSEVILAAFAQWGPDAVTRFIGMFAIALWHQPTRQLHLLRDRLGVKPLYYHWDGARLFFGSELKAVRAFSGWQPEIDRDALSDYLRYGYINAPRTIYQRVFKLPPAHHLVLDAAGRIELRRYWNVLDHVGLRNQKGEAELVDELESLMISAFKYRLIADVPVGLFLSGGVDSSILAAILQKQGGPQVKTFTIGFDVPEFDESPFAADVAQHLGTEHHCRILRVEDAKRVLPHWGDLYDEPFGDESGIPMLMVSQFAAEQVKVVLSADGGDELFSGYENYATTLEQWGRLNNMPPALRALSASTIRGLGASALDDIFAAQSATSGSKLRSAVLSRVARIGRLVNSQGVGELFDKSRAHFQSEEVNDLIGVDKSSWETADVYPGVPGEKLCLWDLGHYLPGDVLAKVDRATMATSIEGREPLIDHRLVEFAFSLPFGMRRGPLGGKHLLKSLLYRYVPKGLVDRPKRGFSVPVKQWLASDLGGLVTEHLDPTLLSRQQLFDPAMVQGYVKRLRAGDASVRQRVWLLVAFQIWFRRWMPVPGGA
jgi:asparagine synthase (glutamine-hydrolysing)